MKKIFFLFLILLTAYSCSSLEEAGKVLRNEKSESTDEFLVKKRKPLVLPPNYNELPLPGSSNNKDTSEENKIKKILKSSGKKINENKSSSTEQSIIDKIRK